MSSLKILTFNIAHGRGLSLYQGFSSEKRIERNLLKIAQMLRQSDADIVALQEVDEDSFWNKRVDCLEYLKKEAGFQHALMGINSRRYHPRRHLVYGDGILSRYPVHFWENNPFGETSFGQKGFMYAEIELKNEVLPLINLHLDYRSRRNRIAQIEQLIDYIKEKRHPRKNNKPIAPIICGDFNSHSKRAGDAVAHLFDYIRSHGDYHIFPKTAATFPAHFPRRMLDFIFLPEAFQPVHCEVVKTYLSDHRPVLLTFKHAGEL
tara:strand:+ start:1249 stop:2037 length:789 start_codon:yes stop_codon:yes gene_type:complete